MMSRLLRIGDMLMLSIETKLVAAASVLLMIPGFLSAQEAVPVRSPAQGIKAALDRMMETTTMRSCPAQAGSTRNTSRFGAGETIYHLVTVNDVPVGKTMMKLDSMKTADGRNAFHVTANGRTNSFFSKVRKVVAAVQSEFDSRTQLPLMFSEKLSDMDVERETRYDIKPAGGSYDMLQVFKGKEQRMTLDGHGRSRDFLSALYHVRTLPLRQGDELCFEIIYARSRWIAAGKVKGVERIQTPAGFFNTIVIDGHMNMLGGKTPKVLPSGLRTIVTGYRSRPPRFFQWARSRCWRHI
jgi:hypothetical protein